MNGDSGNNQTLEIIGSAKNHKHYNEVLAKIAMGHGCFFHLEPQWGRAGDQTQDQQTIIQHRVSRWKRLLNPEAWRMCAFHRRLYLALKRMSRKKSTALEIRRINTKSGDLRMLSYPDPFIISDSLWFGFVSSSVMEKTAGSLPLRRLQSSRQTHKQQENFIYSLTQGQQTVQEGMSEAREDTSQQHAPHVTGCALRNSEPLELPAQARYQAGTEWKGFLSSHSNLGATGS